MRVILKGVCITLAALGVAIVMVVVVGMAVAWLVYFVTTMGLTP